MRTTENKQATWIDNLIDHTHTEGYKTLLKHNKTALTELHQHTKHNTPKLNKNNLLNTL